jgi:hypothetical protein
MAKIKKFSVTVLKDTSLGGKIRARIFQKRVEGTIIGQIQPLFRCICALMIYEEVTYSFCLQVTWCVTDMRRGVRT